MKDTNKELVGEKVRAEYTREQVEKAVDVLALLQTLHMQTAECPGPGSGCVVSESIHLTAQFMGELMEAAWPGSKQAYLEKTKNELLTVMPVEEIKTRVEQSGMAPEVKERLLAAFTGQDGDGQQELPPVKATFMAPPSKLVH